MSDGMKLKEMQMDLWDLANKYIGPEDRGAVLALCGNMMSVCMQLYTVVLQDEDIEEVFKQYNLGLIGLFWLAIFKLHK